MPDLALVAAIAAATLGAGTPLLLAALGELVSEKSGVLNLGVEGMMLMGAALGFAVAADTGHFLLATLSGMLAGAALALVFGFLVLTCRANQVAAGLALTIFGIGASALVGAGYTSRALPARAAAEVPFLSDIPVLGPLLSSLEPLTWLSLASFAGLAWFLRRSRPGLILRGVGDAPESAHALGYPVIAIRYLAVLFGGAMAGLAGVFLSVYYTPTWVENMTAGRGLDCGRAGGLRELETGLRARGRLSLRRRHHPPVSPPGRGSRFADLLHAALPRDHRGAGGDLARPRHDAPARARLPGSALPSRALNVDNLLIRKTIFSGRVCPWVARVISYE